MENGVKNTDPKGGLGRDDQRTPSGMQIASLLTTSAPKLKVFTGDTKMKLEIDDWIRRFEAAAEGVAPDIKLKKLQTFLGGHASNWFEVFIANEKPPLSYDEVIAEMKNYFSLADNKMALRQALNARRQEPDENADEYLTSKLLLCKKVNPKMDEEEKILAIIDGFQPRLKQLMMAMSPTSVKELLKQACLQEISFKEAEKMGFPTLPATDNTQVMESLDQLRKEFRQMNSGRTPPVSYHRPSFRRGPWERVTGELSRDEQYSGSNTRRERYPFKGSDRYRNNYSDQYEPRPAPRQEKHTERGVEREHRPAGQEGKEIKPEGAQFVPRTTTGRIRCYNCGGPHYIRNCPEQEQIPAGNVNSVLPKDVDQKDLIEGFGRVQTLMVPKHNASLEFTKGQLIRSQGYLNGKPVTCMVDTGSTTTCITPFAARRCRVDIKVYSGPTFIAADGKDIEACGYADTRVGINVKNTSTEVSMPVLVLEGLCDDVLLGSDFLAEAGVLVDCEARSLSIKKPIERRIQTVQGRVAKGLEVYLGVRRSLALQNTEEDEAENRMFFPLTINMLRARPDRLPVGQHRNILVSSANVTIKPGGCEKLPVEPFGFAPVYGRMYEVGQADNQITVIPHHFFFQDNRSEIYIENETRNTMVIGVKEMVAYAILTEESVEDLEQRLGRLRAKYQLRKRAVECIPVDMDRLGILEIRPHLENKRTCSSEAAAPALVETEFGMFLDTFTPLLGNTDGATIGNTDCTSIGNTDGAFIGKTDNAHRVNTDGAPIRHTEMVSASIEASKAVDNIPNQDTGPELDQYEEQQGPLDLSARTAVNLIPRDMNVAPPLLIEPESPGYVEYDVVEETGRREWPIIATEDFLIPPGGRVSVRIRHVFPNYEPIEYVLLTSPCPDIALENDLVAMIHGELPSIRLRNTSVASPATGIMGCLAATGRILNPIEIRNYIDEHNWDDLSVFEIQASSRAVIEEDRATEITAEDFLPQDTEATPTVSDPKAFQGRIQMLRFKGRALSQRQVNEVLEFDLDGMIEYLNQVEPTYENVHQYATVPDTEYYTAPQDHAKWTTVHMPAFSSKSKERERPMESPTTVEHYVSLKTPWSLYAGLLVVLLVFGTFMRLTEAVLVENLEDGPSSGTWQWHLFNEQVINEVVCFTLLLAVLGVAVWLLRKWYRHRHSSYGVQERGYWIMNISKKHDEYIEHELDVQHPDLDTFTQNQLGKGQVQLSCSLRNSERDRLMVSLKEFIDVFSFDEQEIGHCSVLTHEIDTGDHAAFKPYYRRARQSSTKFSPYYLMFCREPITPVEIMLDIPKTGTKNPATYSQLLAKQMEVIREVAKANLKKVQHETVSRYNATHRPVEYQEGDHVLIDSPTRYVHRATKLLHRWRGPYEVTKKHSPLKYEVKLVNSKNKKTDTVHINRMKPYFARDRLSSSESDSSASSMEYSSVPNVEKDTMPIEPVGTPAVSAIEAEMPVLTPLPPRAVEPSTEQAVRANFNLDSDTEMDDDDSEAATMPDISKDRYPSTPSTANDPDTAMPILVSHRTPEISRHTEAGPSVSQAPRKSTRVRTKAKMFQIPFLIIGAFALSVNGNFNRGSPVVWRSTPEKLITGNEKVYAIVKLEDTCEIFRELPASLYSKESKEQYLKWCNQAFREDVLDRLTAFCTDVDDHRRTPTTVSMHRPKRAVIAIALIIGVVLSVGFSAVASVINMVEMSKVKEELKNMNSQMERFNRSIELNQQVLRLLEQKMKEQGFAIQENREHIKRLEATQPQSTILVSHLASQFASVRSILNTVGRQWRNRKVDEQLIEFLNISLPCGDDCPLNLATAGKCELDRYRNLLKLEFDLTTINREVKIMKADPFIQLLPGSSPRHMCYKTYIGPMHVLIEEDNPCLMPLPDSAFHDKGYIVSPTTKYCLDWGVKEDAAKLWSSSTCVQADDINPTVRTQVKMTDTDNHIYCPRLFITLHGVNMSCPDYVFTLPKTVSFKIGRLEYNATSHHVETSKHIESDWAHKLSFLINPPFKDFKQDYNDTDKLMNTFDEPRAETSKLQADGVLWATILVLIVLLIICCIRTFMMSRTAQPQHYVEMEMTEQPTATIRRTPRTAKPDTETVSAEI
ncbi:hypothetical protein HDE_12230 [Halotydeus destructor]|nr:hypothetical protein HDE_12230 [Halotydeus destructor]